jgi:hypothetical protein
VHAHVPNYEAFDKMGKAVRWPLDKAKGPIAPTEITKKI